MTGSSLQSYLVACLVLAPGSLEALARETGVAVGDGFDPAALTDDDGVVTDDRIVAKVQQALVATGQAGSLVGPPLRWCCSYRVIWRVKRAVVEACSLLLAAGSLRSAAHFLYLLPVLRSPRASGGRGGRHAPLDVRGRPAHPVRFVGCGEDQGVERGWT